MNGKLAKLSRYAYSSARMERQPATKVTKALMSESKQPTVTSRTGFRAGETHRNMGSSLGHMSAAEFNSYSSPRRVANYTSKMSVHEYESGNSLQHVKNPNESPSKDSLTHHHD